MRATLFKQIPEAKYPDEIYELAIKKRRESKIEESKQLLKKLEKIPVSKSAIAPQLQGLLLSYELNQDDRENQLKYIIKFDEVLKKYKGLLDKQNYYPLIKDFLKIIYSSTELSNHILFVNYLYEILSKEEGIEELRNFKLEYSYSNDKKYATISIFEDSRYETISIWKKYAELTTPLLVTMTCLLYDGRAVSAWMMYINTLLKTMDKNQASEACYFIEKFNLSEFSQVVLKNQSFEEYIEILYKLVEKEIFAAEYFVDLVDRFFEATRNNSFSEQLGSNIADKLYYFQGKCLLCGIDKSKAIQVFEAISEYDSSIYGKACYEIGAYYAALSSEEVDDNLKKQGICEKAKTYLLKAKEYKPEDAEHISELLKNLENNSSETQKFTM